MRSNTQGSDFISDKAFSLLLCFLYYCVFFITKKGTKMKNPPITRTYAIGLGFGNFWLISVCLVFAILDMVNINTNSVALLLSILGCLLIGGGLLFLCIKFLRQGFSLPKTQQEKFSRKRRIIFFAFILLEVVGWGTLDTILGQNNLVIWIVPVNLFIIGAHFIPLAFVFHVPAYLVMGILWLVAITACILLLPSTLIIGNSHAWFTLPSISCAAITWLTSLYLLTTSSRSLRKTMS
jgi:hypothetical protein